MSRILRCLVCFFLICSLLVNLLPVRADATAAGLAGTITAVSGVTVSAPLVIGAAAIALGVMANNTNPLVFENMVNDAVASLSAAGTWVKDGAVELLQTIDETGQKAYYVAGDMLEDLRRWLLDSSYIWYPSTYHDTSKEFPFESNSYTTKYPCYSFSWVYYSASYYYSSTWLMSDPGSNLIVYLNGESVQGTSYTPSGLNSYCVLKGETVKSTVRPAGHYIGERGVDFTENNIWAIIRAFDSILGNISLETHYDLSLGSIPYAGAFTDGSSALEWAEEYARKALKVIEGGNDPDPDSQPPNDGKWFWPLALGLSVGVLGAMSQADEWSGQTPQEFNDYSTKTEFEILNRPEFDGWQGLEIAPVTNPAPDPGTGTNPGTGGDSGETPEVNTDYSTWFSKIYTVVESIPGKLNEIPNKFQSWISDLKTSIQTQTDKLAEHAANTASSIQALPDAFAQSFADVKAAVLSIPDSLKDLFSQKAPSSNMSNFTLDLSKYFPFCIPFDMYDFFTCLRADPVAPVIKWEIYLPGGEPYPLEIDLSPFDSVAQLLRTLQLLLFCVGLAFKTRDLIKG